MYRNIAVALLVISACTLLAFGMSHTMVLQHHYGQHLFGDDLAQGARLSVRIHRRQGHAPLHRLKQQMSNIALEVKEELIEVKEELKEVEDTLMHHKHRKRALPHIRCESFGQAPDCNIAKHRTTRFYHLRAKA
jgi:hypothetical protein